MTSLTAIDSLRPTAPRHSVPELFRHWFELQSQDWGDTDEEGRRWADLSHGALLALLSATPVTALDVQRQVFATLLHQFDEDGEEHPEAMLLRNARASLADEIGSPDHG